LPVFTLQNLLTFTLTQAIKKGLQMGIFTPQQLAELQGVSIEFVENVQKLLAMPEKSTKKIRAKKATKL
jgi:cobalamin-dependent methionine synthase I